MDGWNPYPFVGKTFWENRISDEMNNKILIISS
jgi:hypothetical protein